MINSPTPTPERKCPIRVSDWRKEEAIPLCPVNNCAHPLLRGEKVCPCHAPERKCPNCGGDIAVRNPTGKCDHLYYPENVPTPESRLRAEWDKLRLAIRTASTYEREAHIHRYVKLALSQEREKLMGEIDIEQAAEAVHNAYLDTCKKLGWEVKPANLIPYAELIEDSKELDRASVRAVVALVRGRKSIERNNSDQNA